ncbi:MAG: tryptophan--tRNA ligase [Candidatus Buchananbacteria bacterium]|nr:tryptophan--tRNA ligase [Candidatus Buchananbacteria bacterium]
MIKEIILSGIRPTGRLHIGNYFGALKNFVNLQKDYQCFFFIADLHSLNESFDPKEKHQQIVNLAKDYLAAGLDPKKCTIFLQSDIPQHAELSVILGSVVPVAYLFRMTQFKEKSSDRALDKVNAGLLYYPILMAADILMYDAAKIPVGLDQTQHVELARDVARFFNNKYGQTFIEPKPLYTDNPKIMSLLEPAKKMSKSLGDNHCIYLDDEPEVIKKKISKAVTDTGDGKGLGAKNLLNLIAIFSEPKINQQFLTQAKNKELKYSELKEQLATDLINYLSDFRENKKKITNQQIKKVLADGQKKVEKIVTAKMATVKKRIGIA